MFSPCQENVSCFHYNLLIYLPCCPKQGWLGHRAPRQDSQLRLLAEEGTALCPTVTHLPSGPRISLLLCLTPWNLGYLPHLCREGKPSSCSRGRLWEGAGSMNFCRVFQGSQELLWGGGSANKELLLQEGNLQNSLILFVSPEVFQCGYFIPPRPVPLQLFFFSQLTPLSKIHWDGKLMFSPARASGNGLCFVFFNTQTTLLSVASHRL